MLNADTMALMHSNEYRLQIHLKVVPEVRTHPKTARKEESLFDRLPEASIQGQEGTQEEMKIRFTFGPSYNLMLVTSSFLSESCALSFSVVLDGSLGVLGIVEA